MITGTNVRWRHDPCSARPICITEGKTYEVVDYDPNDRGWPDGCRGTPMVTIIDDDGRRFSAFRYRFQEIVE